MVFIKFICCEKLKQIMKNAGNFYITTDCQRKDTSLYYQPFKSYLLQAADQSKTTSEYYQAYDYSSSYAYAQVFSFFLYIP